MARSLNKVQLIGYTSEDPTTRTFESGNKQSSVTLVTNESVRNRETGTYDDVPEWHRLVFWGSIADTVQNYVRKGTRMYVEGRLKTRSYTDKNNVKRYTTEIIGEQMILLDGRRDGQGGASGQGGYNSNNYSSQGGQGQGGTPWGGEASYQGGNSYGNANNGGYQGGQSQGGYSQQRNQNYAGGYQAQGQQGGWSAAPAPSAAPAGQAWAAAPTPTASPWGGAPEVAQAQGAAPQEPAYQAYNNQAQAAAAPAGTPAGVVNNAGAPAPVPNANSVDDDLPF